MKTFRIIAFFVLTMFVIPSFSQERGFYRIYERDDKSFGPSCAIELSDGSFIVAANDRSVYNELYNYEIRGELIKLSAEGELLRSVPITDANGYCKIENIYRHPTEPHKFIGIGFLVDSEDLPDVYCTVPYLIQFDEELNITLQICPEWPEELYNYQINASTLLDHNGKIFGDYLHTEMDGVMIADQRRFYTQMSVDGEIDFMVEDTTDLLPTAGGTEAIFEFPVTGQKGIFRRTNINPGHQRLYRVNKSWEVEEVNVLYRFAEDTVIQYNSFGLMVYYSTSCIYLMDYVKTNVLPLNDTTLLFSLIGDEHVYECIPSQDTNIFRTESSAVMFKTDIEGNIQQQYCVIGSWNDTIEAIPKCSFGVTNEDAAGNKYIYHCCETKEDYLPYDSPNTMTVTKMTEDFDIVWQKKYAQAGVYMQPRHLLATADGGCFVVGFINRSGQPWDGHHEIFALKLEPDGTVGTGEIIVTDEMFFYPNPTKDVLHLHYPQEMQPQAIELYDLQGRLVHTQTTSLESLSMEGLAAGQYVMKVTMEDGKAFTDKVVKE